MLNVSAGRGNQGQPGPPRVSFLCNLRQSHMGDLPKSETTA